MWPNPQLTGDLVTLTGEILNGKISCSDVYTFANERRAIFKKIYVLFFLVMKNWLTFTSKIAFMNAISRKTFIGFFNRFNFITDVFINIFQTFFNILHRLEDSFVQFKSDVIHITQCISLIVVIYNISNL